MKTITLTLTHEEAFFALRAVTKFYLDTPPGDKYEGLCEAMIQKLDDELPIGN